MTKRPAHSLLASAQRLTRSKSSGNRVNNAQGWQADAWEMYNLVGEQRYLASTLANRMSQARLFVGALDLADPTQAPEPVEDATIQSILTGIGSTIGGGLPQLINRIGVNLFVVGDCWLVGIPASMIPNNDDDSDTLEWRVLSVSELSSTASGDYILALGGTKEERITVRPDEVYLIRIWRPHPQLWWEADSPTRSSLPVLRELVGLTMHISAQVDSRLAGAGLLVVPQSAQRSLAEAAGSEDADEDQFTEALMEAMLTPIGDRSSASALVPLVVSVPDESASLFQYMTFSKPLDTEARHLRDESIRRLALGQDAPPELLLGTSSMNHWGAWLVREDVVSTHIEPPLALICDALTTQYLRPILSEQGYDAERYVVQYDVSHMIMRPDRANDAKALHDKGVLSDDAVRAATGFGDKDAPPQDHVDQVVLKMVTENPTLLAEPGVTALRDQISALLNGTPAPAPPSAVRAEPRIRSAPDDDSTPAGELPREA